MLIELVLCELPDRNSIVSQEPVLVLPDFEKVLEVHTDASDLKVKVKLT